MSGGSTSAESQYDQPISISPSVQTGKFGFCMTFRLGSITHLPPSLKGELYIKWTRGSFNGKTEPIFAEGGKAVAWDEPQTVIIAFSLKKKGMDWESKSITFTLKQIKKGWGTAKDVGRLKLHLGDHISDTDKIYNMAMSSCFSPPPILEMAISSRVESQSHKDRGSEDESEVSVAEGEDFENKTWDTISFADLSEVSETSVPELRKKYDNLRRRAFQLRDAIIKWQNYANKLKDNNNYLTTKVGELEKEKEGQTKEVEDVTNNIKILEGDHNKVLADLEECKKDLQAALNSLSTEKSDKNALSDVFLKQDAEKSGLEEAKGHAMRIVEVYEAQKVTLKNKEEEVDKLTKAIREKDDEISRLTKSLQATTHGKHNHSSLVPSLVGLLILVFFGMLYKFLMA